jgi:DNA-binding IclR family transcriptional regulator
MDDELMAALLGVLEQLWRSARERPGKPCSLAWLSKQSHRPMSTLRRQLALLVDAGWVALHLDDGGVTGVAELSAAGLELAASLFPADQ